MSNLVTRSTFTSQQIRKVYVITYSSFPLIYQSSHTVIDILRAIIEDLSYIGLLARFCFQTQFDILFIFYLMRLIYSVRESSPY